MAGFFNQLTMNGDTPEPQPPLEVSPSVEAGKEAFIKMMMTYYDDPTRQRLEQIEADSHSLEKAQWKERFALIREAYTLLLPKIMRRAAKGLTINPYFIEWDFSPIETNAWCEIRGRALPFYPQVPVAGFFLDFADPYRKICIELDGKQFHDAERDAKRDAVLSELGWEVFRISGKMANNYMADELPEHLVDVDENGSESDDEEEERRSWDDHLRLHTLDGFFKWLKAWFYSKEEIALASQPALDEEEEEEGGMSL